MPFIIAIVLALAAVVLLILANQRQQASGLPSGRIISADTGGWLPVEKPLYDPELGLTGKPDYLVDHNGQLIPVEVKSGRAGEAPHDSHLYQLAAYCRLVEVSYDKRPAYGILHYSNRTFAIDYTEQLEEALLDILAEMRQDERRRNVPRSHQQVARCTRCGYATNCDQRLE